MPKALSDIARAIDQAIREGRGGEAAKTLGALRATRVPARLLPRFAELAWRAGLPDWGLRALRPLVHPPVSEARATASVLAEYACCLSRLGANDEALATLHGLTEKDHPRIAFARAAALVGKWDYAAALPLLERYAAAPGVPHYQRAVARVNLCSAALYERRYARAGLMLRELVHDTAVRGQWLLHAHALQLAAYQCVMRRQFSRARGFLDRAKESLSRFPSIDEVFSRKWLAITDLFELGATAEVMGRIGTLRGEAIERGHWETARDFDRFVALVTRDADLVRKLYFGTPYASFRRRLLEDWKEPLSLPAKWAWAPSGPAARGLDIASGATLDGKLRLPAGGTLHRLLVALAADLYHPARVASLFQALFPGESYHPEHSAPRVHQAIKLLRQWFREGKVPVEIVERAGFYLLAAHAPFSLVVGAEAPSPDRLGVYVTELRRRFSTRPFVLADVMLALGISRRAAQRVLASASGAGQLLKAGKSTATTYRFPDEPDAEARETSRR